MLIYSICNVSMQIFINNDLCVIKCYVKNDFLKIFTLHIKNHAHLLTVSQ